MDVKISDNEKKINDLHFNLDDEKCSNSVLHQLKLAETPKIGIICGSGLGTIGNVLRETQVLPFDKINGFPQTTVKGHKGNLLFGYIGEKYVLCMQGRFHPYEHNMMTSLCASPIRLMHNLGVEFIILSNAAGGINQDFEIGDIMIIKDQIFMPGLCGFSPLIGADFTIFGPRFVSLHDAFDKNMRRLGRQIANEQNIKCHEGTYVMTGGPNYETAVEIRFLHAIGGNAVGSSTCHEVARQCGIKVFGFSLITNKANSEDEDEEEKIDHEKVFDAAKNAEKHAFAFVEEFVKQLKFEK